MYVSLKCLSIIALLYFNIGYAELSEEARAHIKDITLSKTQMNPSNIAVCLNYGCKNISYASFNKQQWLSVVSIFNREIKSPEYERAILAEYIATIEQQIGRQTITQYDYAGSFPVLFSKVKKVGNQMDCIDESIITLSYLKLLDSQGYIKYHDIDGLITRFGIFAGYPHTAVQIIEKQSKKRYVIDSWFYDNGRPAAITPSKVWKLGWKPNK